MSSLARLGIVLVGAALFAMGFVMLFLPGPGALLLLGGLTLLAKEFSWASHLLGWAQRALGALRDWLVAHASRLRKNPG